MIDPIVYLNGKFVNLRKAKVSILDRGFCYGDGLFETLRAYNGKVFKLDWHLERLLHSAECIGLYIPWNPLKLEAIIYQTLKKNRLKDAYIRLTITRGEAPPGLQFPSNSQSTIVVYPQPAGELSPNFYRKGVTVALFSHTAFTTGNLKRQVKSCNYLTSILVYEKAKRVGAFEAILLNGTQRVTDGTVSNFYIVKEGKIKIPKVGPMVLPGITRRVVLEIARSRNIIVIEGVLTRNDLYAAEEAFLTNTGIGILPVVRADDRQIGTGKPGPLTKKIRREFLKLIEDEK